MIIKTLMDNESLNESFGNEHGFSLYIETNGYKILCDTGASSLFLENARRLQVDLSQVDFGFISHGHYDHGGGLQDFLNINQYAKIYLNRNATGSYYSNNKEGDEKRYIGLDNALFSHPRLIMTEGNTVINEALTLFSEVNEEVISLPDQGLLKKQDGQYLPDDFTHEQHLIIKDNEKLVLITGCAHKNIVNILQSFYAWSGQWPTHLFGGFHLLSPAKKEMLPTSLIEQIGNFLLQTPTQYYTGHCTGTDAYQLLKTKLQDRINYLASGSCFEI